LRVQRYGYFLKYVHKNEIFFNFYADDSIS